MNTNTPEIITSAYTAGKFCDWLTDNTDIENVQGFKVNRNEDGCFTGFGESEIFYRADVDELYKSRKIWNDWIRSNG